MEGVNGAWERPKISSKMHLRVIILESHFSVEMSRGDNFMIFIGMGCGVREKKRTDMGIE
jgi:hypothetical protein